MCWTPSKIQAAPRIVSLVGSRTRELVTYSETCRQARSVSLAVSPIQGCSQDALSPLSRRWDAVDINILCHLISVGAREPTIGAHVTLWFLMTILSPPVMACQIIDVSGPNISIVVIAICLLINSRRHWARTSCVTFTTGCPSCMKPVWDLATQGSLTVSAKRSVHG